MSHAQPVDRKSSTRPLCQRATLSKLLNYLKTWFLLVRISRAIFGRTLYCITVTHCKIVLDHNSPAQFSTSHSLWTWFIDRGDSAHFIPSSTKFHNHRSSRRFAAAIGKDQGGNCCLPTKMCFFFQIRLCAGVHVGNIQKKLMYTHPSPNSEIMQLLFCAEWETGSITYSRK